jgi:hypothetical protein
MTICDGVLSLDIRLKGVDIETEHGCRRYKESVIAHFAQISLSFLVGIMLHRNCPMIGLSFEGIAARPLQFAVVLLIDDALGVLFAQLFVEAGWENRR